MFGMMHYFQLVKYGMVGLVLSLIFACQPEDNASNKPSKTNQKSTPKIFEKVNAT